VFRIGLRNVVENLDITTTQYDYDRNDRSSVRGNVRGRGGKGGADSDDDIIDGKAPRDGSRDSKSSPRDDKQKPGSGDSTPDKPKKKG